MTLTGEQLDKYRHLIDIGFWGTKTPGVRSLVDYADELRQYLREKNELIRAYAGPTGMTPEDVAYALAEREGLKNALAGVVDRLAQRDALLVQIRAERIER